LRNEFEVAIEKEARRYHVKNAEYKNVRETGAKLNDLNDVAAVFITDTE
jgi:hypothetical protein